jgi:bacteriocin-like protein
MSKSNAERELTNQSNELTVDELEHVSGGDGTAKPKDPPVYFTITLDHVMISSS